MGSEEGDEREQAARRWFARQLRDFVDGAGGPSLRALALRAESLGEQLPKSTADRALKGEGRPTIETVRAVVRAAHAYAGRAGEPDLGHWERQYDDLQQRLLDARRGSRTVANALAVVQGRGWPRLFGALPDPVEDFQDRHDSLAGHRNGSFLLTGAGGVGKTQATAEYVHGRLAAGDLDLVVWIPATSRDTVVSSMAATYADLAHVRGGSPQDQAERLPKWLADTPRRWCVVLDDLNDTTVVQKLWPRPSRHGITVATTKRRDKGFGQRGTRIELGAFRRDQAVAFLRRRLWPGAGTDDELAALADDLGCLPLALAQVSAYMSDRELDCGAFRERWADSRRKLIDLLPEDSALPDDYPLTLDAAFELALDEADALHPAGTARAVLQVLSVLDPHGVPESVLATAAAAALMPSMPDDRRHAAQHDGVHNLRRLSLLSRSADPTVDTGILRVHVLHQRAAVDRLPAAHRQEVAQRAADALLESWAAPASGSALDRMLRANAFVLYEREPEALVTPEPHEILFRMGRSLGEAGRPAAAVDHFRQIDDRVRAGFGGPSTITFKSRGYLAWWLAQAGQHGEAADAFEALYADQITVLGPEDPDVLQTRQSAAVWRGHSGDLDVARQQLEQLYLDRIRILGPQHRDTLSNRNHLANFRSYCGDFQAAWELHDQSLREAEARLGPDHPDVLSARATAMRHRGELGEPQRAADAYRALADHLQRTVPDHPQAFAARHQFHEWTGRTGDIGSAIAGLEELLADRTRALGRDHPHTLDNRLALVRWRNRNGDRDRALREADELRRDADDILGPSSNFSEATAQALEQR